MAKNGELFKDVRPAATVRLDSYGGEAMLSERGLALVLGVDVQAVLEAQERGELPKSFLLLGERYFTCGQLASFFEDRAGLDKGAR
jgi:hypothetical protein